MLHKITVSSGKKHEENGEYIVKEKKINSLEIYSDMEQDGVLQEYEPQKLNFKQEIFMCIILLMIYEFQKFLV